MNKSYDKFNQPEQPHFYLGSPNYKILCAINGIDESSCSLERKINDTYELSFDIDRFILYEDNGISKHVESNVYLLVDNLMRIFVENVGWFIMQTPTIHNDGIREYKSITAYSENWEFQQHDLKSFKINQGTTDSWEMLADDNVEIIDDVEFAKEQIKFYNPENPQLSLLDLSLKAAGLKGWTIGTIDSVQKVYKYYEDGELKERTTLLSDEIGYFDIESQDLFSFFTQDMAKYFECIFMFDYRKKEISAYRPANLGKDTNINIGFRNLQQSNDIDVDDSSIFTRYYVQGEDSLGIQYVNFGSNYIEDLSYFLNEKYLSKELIQKYKLWNQDLELKRTDYIENTRLYNKQASVISELYDRVPLDDCSTDWSTFEDNKLLEAQKNYQAQLKGYEQFYVDKDGNFDEEALKNSSDANDYYQIKNVILPSIQIEMDNRNLPTDDNKQDYIDTYKTDWKLYGLDELQVKLDEYQNTIDICEKNGYNVPYSDESSHTEDTHTEMYNKYLDAKNQLDPDYEGSCKGAYNQRQSEINHAKDVQKSYDDARKKVASEVEKETWIHSENDINYSFSSQDLENLSHLYYDGDYTNSNMFLVSSDDQVSAIDEQLKLLQAAQDDLYISAHPQYTYTTTLDNFIAKYDYKNYVEHLELGDYVYLGVRDDYVIKLRLISMKYNPLNMDEEITIEFSNMVQSRSGRTDWSNLIDSASGGSKNSATGSSNNFLNNEGITLTAGLIQKLLSSGAFSNKVSQIVNNEFAGIIAGGSGTISIKELNAKMIKVTDIIGENGFFEYLQAKLISADKIVADSGEFGKLSSTVANIDNLLAGNVSSEISHVIKLTAENVSIDEAVIRDLIAANITASMLKAGDISTNQFHITSDDGGMDIKGNTMQFKDANDVVRIQIGRDAQNNFTFCLYDETGKGVLIDSNGIKESAISDGLIKNDMIQVGTISKDKLAFKTIEADENGKTDISNITIDGNGLDVEFKTIQSTVSSLDKKIDDSIPYDIVISASRGNVLTRGVVETIAYAHVYRLGEDVTDQLDASFFIWKRISSDSSGDTYWNEQHSTGTKTLRITRSDVLYGATFTCSLVINGETIASS